MSNTPTTIRLVRKAVFANRTFEAGTVFKAMAIRSDGSASLWDRNSLGHNYNLPRGFFEVVS